MNREIKFRGKSSLCNTWLYGLLVHVGCQYYIVDENDFDTDGHHIKQVQDMPLDVEYETIGQFTGLHDKNGEEVYEGDIVRSCKYKNIKHFVSYDDKIAAFVAVCIDENTRTDLETKCHITQEWIDNYPKEVIGNIYDNKGLLNQE